MARTSSRSPVPGTRSAKRVKEDTSAADRTLTPADLDRIKEILPTGGFSARYPESMRSEWE